MACLSEGAIKTTRWTHGTEAWYGKEGIIHGRHWGAEKEDGEGHTCVLVMKDHEDREKKERTEVVAGQEQLAGEQRYETSYGQSRNPMSNIFEVQVCLVMLAWT